MVEVGELVAAVRRTPGTPDEVARLFARSGRNPFFVEELDAGRPPGPGAATPSLDAVLSATTSPPRAAGAAPGPQTPEFERLITEVSVSGGPGAAAAGGIDLPRDAGEILNVATERALTRPEALAHDEPDVLLFLTLQSRLTTS